jgi:hypothetical protein
MREIQIEGVWWHIGTFRHVAHVTQIALIDNLDVIRLINTIHFHGVTFVDKIKQRGKGIAQAVTAATTMANIKYTL